MDLGQFVVFVAVFAATVAVLFIAIKGLARAMFGPRRQLEAELGLEALERRLERGEITQEEFEQAGSRWAPERDGTRQAARGDPIPAGAVTGQVRYEAHPTRVDRQRDFLRGGQQISLSTDT
jgi:hypothetical protein